MFVLIIWIFLFYGLSRCQIRSSTGSMSRYTNITVFTVKKEPLNENTVLKCLNVQEIISRVRGFAWNLDDFSRRYWKANIGKFRRGVHTEIYRVFKVKNPNEISIGKCKVYLNLKVSIFNSQNRCKVVVPDELGREQEHFNWAFSCAILAWRVITDAENV